MSDLPVRIAQAALNCFAKLPAKCKPRTFADGRREWTPLSAIVTCKHEQPGVYAVECVSLATGTKCLPATSIPDCDGAVLHDSHAEILALRGFNRWLLQEVENVLEHPDYSSLYIEQRLEPSQDDPGPPFRLREDISCHFFTTEAPCGDASMELLIDSKTPEEAVPWAISGGKNVAASTRDLPGRGNFGLLGVVRRKPARADAQASLSKSCSDKLTVKQMTSLLSFPADVLFELTPSAFIETFIVPHDQYNETSYQRAFCKTGRLQQIPQFALLFEPNVLPPEFPRFEFANTRGMAVQSKASNISTVWIKSNGHHAQDTLEILLNGVKQGFKQMEPNMRKQSCLCRRQMFVLGQSLALRLGRATCCNQFPSYREAKNIPERLRAQQRKKDARHRLGAWPPNVGDDHWTLQSSHMSSKSQRLGSTAE